MQFFYCINILMENYQCSVLSIEIYLPFKYVDHPQSALYKKHFLFNQQQTIIPVSSHSVSSIIEWGQRCKSVGGGKPEDPWTSRHVPYLP